MKSLEKISVLVLGGLGGFISALIILLIGMREKVNEPFFSYWFVHQPPFSALIIMTSFACIGCLISYIRDELISQGKEMLRLQDINKTTNEFVSLITHQMRSPLSSVSFGLSMLLKGDFGRVSEEQKSVLQKAYGSTKGVIILTQDLLDITKLTLGKLGFSLRYLSFGEIEKNIKDTIQKFVPMIQSKGISFVSSFVLRSENSIRLDWLRINQVIENLIENAFNYTPSGGQVRVELRNNTSYFSFGVSDTGIGIPKEEQPKIFSKFFRASNARKTQSGGTGIGLYLCREIIRAHGGSIWFVSNKDEGTSFYFSLPLFSVAKSGWGEIEEFFIKI